MVVNAPRAMGKLDGDLSMVVFRGNLDVTGIVLGAWEIAGVVADSIRRCAEDGLFLDRPFESKSHSVGIRKEELSCLDGET